MRYRSQVRNPLNKTERINVTAESPGELEARKQKIRELRRDLRIGVEEEDVVREKLERASGGPLTVKEAWEAHVERLAEGGWKRQAKSTWKHRLARWFGGLTCAQLSEDVMQKWEAAQYRAKTQTRKPLSWRTIRNAYDLLAAAIAKQVEKGRLARVPWGRWRPASGDKTEKPIFRSIDDLAAFLRETMARDERVRALTGYADLSARCLVGLLAGLRQGEIGGLGWHDFDNLDGENPLLDERLPNGTTRPRVMYQIRRQVTDGWRERDRDAREPPPVAPTRRPKGRRDKPLDPAMEAHASLAAVIRAQREQLRRIGWYRPDGPVFPARPTGDWRGHADAIHPEREFRPCWRAAGLPRPEEATPHCLRHTMVTWEIVLSGGDLVAVQRRSRHKDVKVLLGYYHALSGAGSKSRIPELELPIDQIVPPPSSTRPALPERPVRDGDPWGVSVDLGPVDLVELTADLAEQHDAAEKKSKAEKRREAKQKYLGRDVADFEAALQSWLAKGCPPPRPREVTEAMQLAYSRGYKAKLRGFEDPEGGRVALTEEQLTACRRAGAYARRGTVAAWERFKNARLAELGRALPAMPRARKKRTA